MGGRFRLAAALLAAGLMTGGAVTAGTPDPAFSDIGNVVFAPGGSIPYEVTIGSSNGPVPGAEVTLVFTTPLGINQTGDELICWCAGQPHPNGVTAITDPFGVATFILEAGGCIDPATVPNPPVDVYVNGALFASVGAVSPDAVDAGGKLPVQGWNPGANCGVSVGDAVFHTIPLKTGAYSFCTDFDSDLDCDLTDAVVLTPAVKNGVFCLRDIP